ncbi:uncharacterized protein PG998_012115 [Apiospora kogelbergensis]|uniref:uncharacterized protein n=1 Tax=Apiospora kogelbergensis TaxID=1337665 RepID=UPI003130227E
MASVKRYFESPKKTLLLVTVTILATWGLIDILSRVSNRGHDLISSNEPNIDIPCWCGSSDEEAAALGCIYDHIAVDWLPTHCHDADLVDEFDASGPAPPNGTWPYYRATSHGIMGPQLALLDEAITIDSLARGGEDYFATVEWHVAHCLFTWRKQVKSRHEESNLVVEPWNDDEDHVRHCSGYIWNVIRNGRSLDEVDTIIPGKARHERRFTSTSSFSATLNRP